MTSADVMDPEETPALGQLVDGADGVQTQGEPADQEARGLVDESRVVFGARLGEVAEHLEALAQRVDAGPSPERQLEGLEIEPPCDESGEVAPRHLGQRRRLQGARVLLPDLLGGVTAE